MSEQLQLDAAWLSEAGVKAINEDCAGLRIPDDDYLKLSKGATLVVADGVSSAEAGREASQTAVRRFLEEYYQTPDTWSVSHCGEKILSTINLRLFRQSQQFATEGKGFLSTFSSVVIKGRTAHFFHVGDSRIYHLHNNELVQRSSDHTATISSDHSFLARAIGMDNRLHIDYGKVALAEGDVLLLCSDGVHDFIPAQALRDLLASGLSAEACARALIDTALANGSDDNLSAVVARVVALPGENLDEYSAKLTRLPFPPALSEGLKIDGYQVLSTLFESARSHLYLVRDLDDGAHYVLKSPSRNFEDDINYIDRFVQEEWIGSRIDSPHVVKIVKQKRKRNFLYYLMAYVPGQSLDTWAAAHQPLSPKRAIALVKQIAAGLQAFHQNEAVHQDLKPGNILVTEDNQVVIVDFGSVYVAGLAELQRPLEHEGALGTASYSDPLYLLGRNPGIQGDVYALATIVYELFTGHLPYGDAADECQTARDYDRLRYHSAGQYNPVIPPWFDKALEKGVNFDLEQRYTSVAALLADLCQPNPAFLRDEPVSERSANTLLFWKLLSGFWFVTLMLVIYLFAQN